MARTIRFVRPVTLEKGWAVLVAALVIAAGTVFPSVGVPTPTAEAVGSGCTASTNAILHQFSYQGTQYCTEEFRGSGNWTKPSWVTTVDVVVVGGGGLGGSHSSSGYGGGGGGGGGVVSETSLAFPSSSYAVVVGCGGGNSGCSASGGTSSFGGNNLLRADGGQYGGNSGTGGLSGNCYKNNSNTCTTNAGGSPMPFFNGAPQFSMGGGGGGFFQPGSTGSMLQDQYTTTFPGLGQATYTRSNIGTHPFGGMGAQLLSAYWGVGRVVGCGGGGGISVNYSNDPSGPRWRFYLDESTFWNQRYGCAVDYNSGYGGRNYTQPFVTGFTDDPDSIFQAGTTSNAMVGTYRPADGGTASGNGGGGQGGCNPSPNSGSQPSCSAGLGAAGVVLIRYIAPVPVNTAVPTISPSNTPWVGTTLTRTQGTWTTPMGNLVTPYAGKWVRRLNSVDTDIPGATNPTYTVTQADIGYQILYVETADNGLGTASASSTPTVAVQGQPAFTSNSPSPLATLNQAFTYTFVASGGAVTYSLVNSDLPGTITLSSAGVLSGTPTVAGSYTYTVRATNSVGSADTTHQFHAGRTAVLNTSSTPQTSGATFTISPTVTLTTGTTPGVGVAVTATIQAGPGGTPVLGGPITQNTNSSGVATFSGLTLTGLVGTYTVRFSAGSNWPVADLTVTLSAGPATALAVATQPVGNVLPGVNLQTVPVVRVVDSGGNVITSSSAAIAATIATGSQNASLSVTSVNATSGVATFTGMKVNNAGGNFTITFSSTGLTSVTSNQFTINRTAQTTTFTYSGGSKTYTSADFGVSASTTSQLPIAFTSATPSVCGVTGSASAVGGVTGAVVSIEGVGLCTIHADQAGDDQYSPAARQSINFNVTQVAQSTFAISSTGARTFGDTLTLATTGGSGTGAVGYQLVGGAGSAQCTLDQTTGAMTFGAAGTCTVSATKAADANFTSITSANHVITVALAPQSTSITSAVPARPVAGGTHQVTATASSGLAPTLTILSGAGTVCSISGSSSPATVTFIDSGACVVVASQSGNGNYLPAAVEARQTIVVGSLNQTITFNSLANRDFGDPSSQITVSATSALSVVLTNDTPTVCSLSGRTVSILTVGRCTITASQAGNSTWVAASPVSRSFDIAAVLPSAPSITSVSAQSTAIMVGFTAPGFSGGLPVTGYRLVATPTGTGSAVTSQNCATTSCVIDGLVNGTEYVVTVAAINGVGVGPASSVSPPVTPATAALAVRNAVATPGNNSLTVTWLAPSDFGGGTFTRYELRIRPQGGTWPVNSNHDVTTSTVGTHTFNGLDNGTTYEVQIVTITSANQAANSGNTAVVFAVPRSVAPAPLDLTVTETSPRGATISWSEPVSNGGSTITGYTVAITAGTSSTGYSVATSTGVSCGTVTIDATSRVGSCAVTNLALGTTYTVTVRAENGVGSGSAASTTYTTRSFSAPGAPGVPTCTNCISDPPGNPGDPEGPAGPDGPPATTPPSSNPGEITLTDGVATVKLTTAPGTASNVDSLGRLVVRSTGTLRVVGTGLLSSSASATWWNRVAWDDGVVDDDGEVTIDSPVPTNASSGVTVVQVDVVTETGVARRFNFTVLLLGTSPPPLPGTTSGGSGGNSGSNVGGGGTGGGNGGDGGGDSANDPTQPCSGCVSVFPSSIPTPPVTSSNPGTSPAQVTVTTSNGVTATLGGEPGTGGATTTTSSTGGFTVTPPGTIPVRLSGLRPGSQVTVWISDTFAVTGSVGADGTISLDAALPEGLQAGRHTVRVDAVAADGTEMALLFGIEVVARSGRLPTTGTGTSWPPLIALWLLTFGVLVAEVRRRWRHLV